MSKQATFGERIVAARTKKEWTRADLNHRLHLATCGKKHEADSFYKTWPAPCQAAYAKSYLLLGSIEKGRAVDEDVEAVLTDILAFVPKQARTRKSKVAEAEPVVEDEAAPAEQLEPATVAA